MGPITEAIYKSVKPHGNLTHEGFTVQCAGQPGMDANGSPVTTDRHNIAVLGPHAPGAVPHAWTNSEFTDDLWIIDPAQTSINWSAPVCQVCGKELAP